MAFSWAASSSDGGSPLLRYEVAYEDVIHVIDKSLVYFTMAYKGVFSATVSAVNALGNS